MKNIQAVDRAENCIFSIYSVTDEDFRVIFPGVNQELEFVEDLVQRVGEDQAGEIVQRLTSRPIHKQSVFGIHGTLFFNLPGRKIWFPNKREDDVEEAGQIVGRFWLRDAPRKGLMTKRIGVNSTLLTKLGERLMGERSGINSRQMTLWLLGLSKLS